MSAVACPASHLEAAVAQRALDEHGRLHDERLQEEDPAQRRSGRHRSAARHLEVARAGKDDAALHDVAADEGEQRARSWRVEDGFDAVRRGQRPLHKWVRLVVPQDRP